MTHWIARLARDDASQALALAEAERGRPLTMSERACTLDRLARDLGWLRARGLGWVREEAYLALAQVGAVSCYRHAHDGHRRARMRVSPDRRAEIARIGAAARVQRAKGKSC